MSATPTGADAMKEADLKPCPFCNLSHTLKVTSAQALAQEGEDDPEPWTHSDSYAVMCDARRPDGPGGCGASGGFFPTDADAIAAWNRRSVEAQPAAVAGEADWHQILVALDLGAQHARWSRDRSMSPGEHTLNAQDVRKLEVALSAAQRLAANPFHRPACDSSEASGSAIPARPTLPAEDARATIASCKAIQKAANDELEARVARKIAEAVQRAGLTLLKTATGYEVRKLGSVEAQAYEAIAREAGGTLLRPIAAPVHPSSVQAVDGDERAARICEALAQMVDDGAGAVGRLWQAARMIRGGEPVPGWYDPSRKEPL